MRSLRIDVDERTVERLETERELLGFEDTDAYLNWIIDNRAAIEQGTERDQLLSTYAERVEELEARLEERVAEADRSADDAADEETAGVEAPGFSPERVTRVTDEELHRDASELSTVETERLDEFARRAVARTRDQLGRGVTTGLAYDSRTSIADDTVRPGEDIADLDSLDLPGYDDEDLQRRRRAVGAALAYLKDKNRARRADFVDALYEEFPAAYDSESSWWRCVKRGLEQVPAVEGGEGKRVWEFEPVVDPDARVRVRRIPNDG